jgi:hypothetical protein
LAALGLSATARVAWRRWLTVLALATAIPSNLIVIAAGLGGVARGEPVLVQSKDESCALEWLAAHAEPGALVLAGEIAGNRIPAVTNLRVFYGHPFETPDVDAELALVQRLFSRTTELDDALPVLEARGVDFVYVGPEEAALGPASWPQALTTACVCGQVTVYRVQAP